MKQSITLIIIPLLLLTYPLFGQSTSIYESVSQCVLQTMRERKLTGNEMFEVVKEECERILVKVEGKGKKKQQGILFYRVVNGKWGYFRAGDEKKDFKYLGEIVNGKPNGSGTYTSPGGLKYVGEFKDGIQNGQGVSTYPSGNKYVGEWRDGKYDGQGTFSWSNGRKRVGEFRNDRPWKITEYNKYGNIHGKYVDGEWIKN